MSGRSEKRGGDVFVIGKDFGAMVAYTFALFHPEKVAGIITLGVPFMRPGFHKTHLALPEGFYIRRWQKSGFQTPLKVPYRSFGETIGSPQQDPNDLKIKAPALLIMGEEDYVFKFPGMEEYVRSGEVKKYVPNLEIIYLPHGCHFVHEQFPDQVNQLVLNFLNHNKH
ncbi:hypothetical protein E3N88_45005 [Mikania micrantha]|uniref:AB hydrolase-1 domain-containing protein n=1 Tax=Mikania micrantha TaxID=192012 RepID=A0A5N6LAP1_9ASTR|nr:hypothetical protein E3N88_45005 [Mikania micrantha]